jgi:hypothetical protein
MGVRGLVHILAALARGNARGKWTTGAAGRTLILLRRENEIAVMSGVQLQLSCLWPAKICKL